MRVFVTGGTGYFGQRLCRDIIGAGHRVFALARSIGSGAPLEAMGAEVVLGDVTVFDEAEVDLASFAAVIHSAALVRTRAKDPAEFDLVNVRGVANVARRALDSGVKRFLYTSSFMALGPSPDGKPLDETASHDPAHLHNDYERTKYLGLVEFENWVARGLPGIVLIPCVIYGPGALTSGNITAWLIADLIKRRLPGVLGDGRSVWTYSFVEDVVEGHIQALSKGRPGQRYILGGESLSMQEFVDTAAYIARVRPPRFHIPYWLAKVAALADEVKSTISRREPRLTRQVVEIYKHDWVYSCEKAKRDLDYRVTPARNALAQTIDWIKMAIEEKKI